MFWKWFTWTYLFDYISISFYAIELYPNFYHQQLANSRGMDGSNLASLTEKLERCKSEYENLKAQKKKLESELQQVKRDLDSSQVQKRDLEDSLQIRKFEQDMER